MMQGIGSYVLDLRGMRELDGTGAMRRGFDGFSGLGDDMTSADANLYTVKSGDSLSLITWRFGMGPEAIWDLYAGNSAVIGANPDLIKIGQVYALPSGWPAAPVRSDAPNAAWNTQALAALKAQGYKPTYVVPTPVAPVAPKPAAPVFYAPIVVLPKSTPAPVAQSSASAWIFGGIAVAGLLMILKKSSASASGARKAVV